MTMGAVSCAYGAILFVSSLIILSVHKVFVEVLEAVGKDGYSDKVFSLLKWALVANAAGMVFVTYLLY